MNTTEPLIGTVREYDEVITVLYPGEVATPIVGRMRTLPDGATEVIVTSWRVGPAPGWRAVWRRARYWYCDRHLPAWLTGPLALVALEDTPANRAADEDRAMTSGGPGIVRRAKD